MKTDTLFYRLFQTVPSLFFELLGETAGGAGYQFASIELKQTAFRIDGVFLPPEGQPSAPVYFLEVQFQLCYRKRPSNLAVTNPLKSLCIGHFRRNLVQGRSLSGALAARWGRFRAGERDRQGDDCWL